MRFFIVFLIIICMSPWVFAADKDDRIVFGIASVISAEESVTQYTDLAKYISKKTGLKVDIIRSGNYTDMNGLINAGRVSFASICTGALLYLDDVNILALPVVDGKSTYNSYIIANKNSGIKSLKDMEGKSFAFTDPISNSGTLYPKYLVAKLTGKSAENFFHRTFYNQSHDKSIYLVNRNVIDGAAVDSLIYDFIKAKNPQDVANIEIIDVSPAFMSPPFVASANLPKEMASKIRNILINMDKDEEGRNILRLIGIDKFTVPANADLQTIFEMKRYVENIK